MARGRPSSSSANIKMLVPRRRGSGGGGGFPDRTIGLSGVMYDSERKSVAVPPNSETGADAGYRGRLVCGCTFVLQLARPIASDIGKWRHARLWYQLHILCRNPIMRCLCSLFHLLGFSLHAL